MFAHVGRWPVLGWSHPQLIITYTYDIPLKDLQYSALLTLTFQQVHELVHSNYFFWCLVVSYCCNMVYYSVVSHECVLSEYKVFIDDLGTRLIISHVMHNVYTVALPQFGVSRKSWYFFKSSACAYYKRYDALPWISGKSGSRRSSPQVRRVAVGHIHNFFMKTCLHP